MFSMFLREFYVPIKNIYLLSYFDKSYCLFHRFRPWKEDFKLI